MKKHYLISTIFVPLGIWWMMNPGTYKVGFLVWQLTDWTMAFSLTVLFIAYPFMIDYLHNELDKEHEEGNGR